MIDTVARAKGMIKTAKEAGISREGLYKALSPNGNPSFATVCKILNAIGYTLVPTRIAKSTPKVSEMSETDDMSEIYCGYLRCSSTIDIFRNIQKSAEHRFLHES